MASLGLDVAEHVINESQKQLQVAPEGLVRIGSPIQVSDLVLAKPQWAEGLLKLSSVVNIEMNVLLLHDGLQGFDQHGVLNLDGVILEGETASNAWLIAVFDLVHLDGDAVLSASS